MRGFPTLGYQELGKRWLGDGIQPGGMMSEGVRYLLRDDFTDTVAAGSVNGTLSTPGGQVRTVTDTNLKLSIGSSSANFATGGAAYGNPGLWYPVITRAAGRMLLGQITITSLTSDTAPLGLDINQTGIPEGSHAFYVTSASTVLGVYDNTTIIAFGVYATATAYQLAIVLRATGALYFIKGGAWTNWTLVWISKLISTATLYPTTQGKTTSVFSTAFVRMPQSLIIIQPVASDAFTRANGAIGITGGGGSEETGGSGLTWTAQKGTWTVASNVATCTALADSLGIATVPCGTTNIMVEVVATRAAGTSGLVLRYTDVNNYIKCVHNGTNLQVIEVVAGTPNTLVNAVATYGATTRMIVSLDGNKVRAYYGVALIGVEATTAVITGNNHGLFTDDTGATFDNFVVFAKGNGGEYNGIFNKYANP